MDAVLFWEMTYKEIINAIKGYIKRKNDSLREQAVLASYQAKQIAHLVGIAWGSKEQEKEIYEYYPNFFPELERKAMAKKSMQQHWLVMKERIETYASHLKEKREKEERERGDSHGHDN